MQGMAELVWFSQSKNQEASGKSKGRRARLKFIGKSRIYVERRDTSQVA